VLQLTPDGRGRVLRPGPLWLKAPFVLLRYPAILAAVLAAAVIVGVTSAASPLFLASAAGSAMEDEVAQLGDRLAGMSVRVYGPAWSGEDVRSADDALRAGAARIRRLGTGELTMLGSAMTAVGDTGRAGVRLLARQGAAEHLDVVAGARDARGVWLVESAAAQLGVTAGQQVRLTYGSHEATVTVAGVYRSLLEGPLSAYWQPYSSLILPRDENRGGPPPPLAIADAQTYREVSAAVRDYTEFQWAFPLSTAGLDVASARRTSAQIRHLSGAVADRRGSELGGALAAISLYRTPPGVDSALAGTVRRVDLVLASLTGPVRGLALAGSAVALVVVAATALFAARSRRVELQVRAAQGVLPRAEALRAVTEAGLPVGLGVVGGWGMAWLLIGTLGPGPVTEPGAAGAALRSAAAVGGAALLLLGVVTGVAARRALLALGGARGVITGRGGAWWEILPLALGAVAFYQIAIRGTALVVTGDQTAQLDVLVLAFPVLFIAGFAGLAARGLRALLPRLRRLDPASPAAYLAARRLAGAAGITTTLLTLAALSVGILTYAATSAASTSATVDAKAAVATGSDTVLRLLGGGEAVLPGREDQTALVRRRRVRITPGDLDVDLLGVDPAGFPRAAFTDPAVLGADVAAAVARLARADATDRVPVLVAGDRLPAEFLFATRSYDLPMRVLERLPALPGTSTHRPVVLLDWRHVEEAASAGPGRTPAGAGWTGELWVADPDTDAVADEAHAAALRVMEVRSVAAVRRTSGVQPVTWTLGLLQALGYLAGLLALVGILLYAQSRQQAREVSYALARRMGLTSRQHWAGVTLELAAILGAATVIGTGLAVAAAALTVGRLDPLPALAPDPLLRLPWTLLVLLPVTVALVAALGAALVQRAADRADVAEVMRLAE
jgi:putative ABC transport system permease protein